VLDRQDAVEAALVHGVDQAHPVDLAEAGHAVAPPADVPGVVTLDGLAGPAVVVAAVGEQLDVLRLGVGDAVDVGPYGGDRVDAHPDQVGRVVVEVQPDAEHPLPQLRGVREVAGVPVRVPTLHHAVLDDDLDSPLAGPVDQRGEHGLGVGQVLPHRPARVAADERADRGAAQVGGGLDAPQDVPVDRLPLGGVGVEVVVVVGQRRQREAAVGEQPEHLVVVVALRVEVGGGERAVAERRPGGHLQRLVAVVRRPGGDVAEGPLGQAGGQEAELHVLTSIQD